jgi:transposase InsO family protein
MDKREYRNLRFRWYNQVLVHKRSVKDTCQIFGISRKTYYKWYKRDYAKIANKYIYCRREQPNLKLTEEVQGIIRECKLKTNYGPLKMRLYLKQKHGLDLSTTIIYRFYKRKGLIRKPQRKLPWYKPMKQHITITRPGQGVQIDVKYVYESGKRQFLFSCLDPYTFKYYAKVFDKKESKNAIILHKEAERYFGFKILSVQTDNGSEFRSHYHNWLTKHQIPHYFIPKHSPFWNHKVERVHKTIDDEYFLNPYTPYKTFREWLHFYNFERIIYQLTG